MVRPYSQGFPRPGDALARQQTLFSARHVLEGVSNAVTILPVRVTRASP
jgi:hypothetical protein